MSKVVFNWIAAFFNSKIYISTHKHRTEHIEIESSVKESSGNETDSIEIPNVWCVVQLACSMNSLIWCVFDVSDAYAYHSNFFLSFRPFESDDRFDWIFLPYRHELVNKPKRVTHQNFDDQTNGPFERPFNSHLRLYSLDSVCVYWHNVKWIRL